MCSPQSTTSSSRLGSPSQTNLRFNFRCTHAVSTIDRVGGLLRDRNFFVYSVLQGGTMSRWTRLSFLFACFCLGVALGQDVLGTIVGTVTDASGAGVPGA